MGTKHFKKVSGTSRSGYAMLIMLLIVIAIAPYVLWVLMSDPDKRDRETKREQVSQPDKYPWVEEWRIKHLKKRKPWGVKSATAPQGQPVILKNLGIEANTRQGRALIGSVSITIAPDGTLEGAWGADYESASPRAHHATNGQFKGNTDPTRICTDANGVEQPYLFFIGKGEFAELETNYETNRVRRRLGMIYVRGWLDNEFNSEGSVHLTFNKREQRVFAWKGEAEETFPMSYKKPGLKTFIKQALAPRDRTKDNNPFLK